MTEKAEGRVSDLHCTLNLWLKEEHLYFLLKGSKISSSHYTLDQICTGGGKNQWFFANTLGLILWVSPH